jgi:hypothetical protein
MPGHLKTQKNVLRMHFISFRLAYWSITTFFFYIKKLSNYQNGYCEYFITLRDAGTSQKTKKYPKDTIFKFWASLLISIIHILSKYHIFLSNSFKPIKNGYRNTLSFCAMPGHLKIQKKYLKDTIFKFRATRLNYIIHMLSKYNIF